ncbi:PREDICTED: thioredoxin domain-containing protein 17-like [Wasmannia auropunctata]|uniref:thioredoxin domain-containing protein 17-like n=1 Tax=Wasmannia auropunctata TaxID=64793 RepID=UPI0005F036D5|nr:PREDICTED: thioredoxin domain-containing protein 17-like [Wasmannia auropunctata]XP_011698701.1 PREDICTED: thioredoxin domain-containing protein 17-like [Wasmannia auropunctata]
MVERQYVRGYEEFLKFTDESRTRYGNTYDRIYVLYTGTKLPDTGESWCPDCVEAEPYIENGFKAISKVETILLVIVEVGDRPFWKDPNCPFRTNVHSKLKVLPTLARWGTQKRLEGDQLLDPELIEMLLTDGDD